MKDNITQVNLSGLKELLHTPSESKTFFILDETFFQLYDEKLGLSSLENKYLLKNSEEDKSLEQFQHCIDFMIDNDVRRNSIVWAIGGGATSDFAGFVASSVLRGIGWNIIPTTLLSMVDASVGGKVGLNLTQGKNLIGAFHQAGNVYLCYDFLETLDKQQLESGMGEIIKYCFLSTDINRMIKREIPIEDIILACLKFKKEVVQKDIKDLGSRMMLNFGHTLGHAFEKEQSLVHGKAILLGIYYTLKVFRHDMLSELYTLMDKLELDKNFLLTRPGNDEDFWNYVYKDKKIINDELNFITIRSIGYPMVEKVKIDELRKKIAFR